ncbi:hypothetical protein RCO48_31975 [Peribacillus frigoritolerans]|nr:hypothetical protein [Peribacillus frigoritolerans]
MARKKAYIMEFLTFKTTVEEDGKLTESIMTDIALKAYNTLVVIGEARRINGSNVLYPNQKGEYFNTSTFGRNIIRFFSKKSG